MGDIIKTANDNTEYVLINKPHTAIQHTGQTLSITVQAAYSGGSAPTATATLVNMAGDGQTVPPAPSGIPPQWNVRGMMNEVIGSVCIHNAGDHVKFGFPMSASVTLLEWGLLQYKDAYVTAGQLEYMYDSVRWPLEWLLKAHITPDELYIQVGDGGLDHAFWGRPEDMKMIRPAYKIDVNKPGSDVAGEYAAAMAAGYLVFKDKDPQFASQLLQNSKEIYDFAVNYKGIYSNSVNQAAAYYRSNAYEDDLCWPGAWLYMATNVSTYLTDAETYQVAGPDWGQSWDDKGPGCIWLPMYPRI